MTKLLASWTPLPPSQALEDRIFGRPAPEPPVKSAFEPSAVARWFSWGVPSLGTAFIVASLWIHPAQPVNAVPGFQAAQLAALHSAAAQSAQNALPVRFVAWTNASQTLTTNSLFEGVN